MMFLSDDCLYKGGGNTNKIQADPKHVTTADLVYGMVSVRARNVVAANI